jgi:hypothetical protein
MLSSTGLASLVKVKLMMFCVVLMSLRMQALVLGMVLGGDVILQAGTHGFKLPMSLITLCSM